MRFVLPLMAALSLSACVGIDETQQLFGQPQQQQYREGSRWEYQGDDRERRGAERGEERREERDYDRSRGRSSSEEDGRIMEQQERLAERQRELELERRRLSQERYR